MPLSLIADRPEPRALDRSRNPKRCAHARVFLSATLPYRILFGADLVADRELAGCGHVDALVLDQTLPIEVLVRAEAGDLDGRIDLACLLFEAGVTQSDIADVLRIDKTEVTRLRQIAAAPIIRSAVRAGQISLGHARVLARKSPTEQSAGVAKLVKSPVSVRAFESDHHGRFNQEQNPNPADPGEDPNVAAYRDCVAEALSAQTQLTTRRGRWSLSLGWSHLAELQGILEALGRGNATGRSNLPNRPRSIVIECDSDTELESLVEHLLAEE